jgi:1-deoxy-D-xylulose-5-phosphate synthase
VGEGSASGGGWFEHFGLLTVGPIDGHNLPELIEFLREARDMDRPMVLHVKTVKGKGYQFAEQDSSKFHSRLRRSRSTASSSPTGAASNSRARGRSFTTAFGDAMVDLMERIPRSSRAPPRCPMARA